jgi:hypothetical protein
MQTLSDKRASPHMHLARFTKQLQYNKINPEGQLSAMLRAVHQLQALQGVHMLWQQLQPPGSYTATWR